MISLGTMFSVARRSALPSLSLLSAPVTGVRFVSIMSSLSNNPGAYRKKKRLGRGPSSGKGKTSGRGMNGQKQKEKVARWHEGGQTPMHKMLPKFGFNVYQKKKYVKLNLDRVQSWIEQGRLDPSKPITMKHLLDSRACRGIKDGVKLLANGKENFKYPINITVNAASREAVKAVRALGGKVTSRYYNQLTLRALLHPEFFKRLPLPADPVDKASLEYYRKPEVGGYLARPAKTPTAETTESATTESA